MPMVDSWNWPRLQGHSWHSQRDDSFRVRIEAIIKKLKYLLSYQAKLRVNCNDLGGGECDEWVRSNQMCVLCVLFMPLDKSHRQYRSVVAMQWFMPQSTYIIRTCRDCMSASQPFKLG